MELLLSGFVDEGTVALAGRRTDSLEAVKLEVLHETSSDPDLMGRIGVIEANTSDEDSLRRMATQARVCINAVGPFRFHGRQVVRACIEVRRQFYPTIFPEFIGPDALAHSSTHQLRSFTASLDLTGWLLVPGHLRRARVH